MPALWNNEELQLQLNDGLAQVLRANPRMPSSPLLEPLLLIFASSGSSSPGGSSCFMCWQLVDALIHHPRIEEAARLQVRFAALYRLRGLHLVHSPSFPCS
jgi:hypothetical protein